MLFPILFRCAVWSVLVILSYIFFSRYVEGTNFSVRKYRLLFLIVWACGILVNSFQYAPLKAPDWVHMDVQYPTVASTNQTNTTPDLRTKLEKRSHQISKRLTEENQEAKKRFLEIK